MACADEVGHIEFIIRCASRDGESGGEPLARAGAALVGAAGEGGSFAGYIDHLTLVECVVKVFGEPDGPVVSKSLFSSSFGRVFHNPVPRKALTCGGSIGRRIEGLYLIAGAARTAVGATGNGEVVLGGIAVVFMCMAVRRGTRRFFFRFCGLVLEGLIIRR